MTKPPTARVLGLLPLLIGLGCTEQRAPLQGSSSGSVGTSTAGLTSGGSSSSGSTSAGSTGGSTGASSTAGTTSSTGGGTPAGTSGNPVTLIDAGEDGGFWLVSLAAAGDEAELLYSSGGGWEYPQSLVLQHLSLSGAASGASVLVSGLSNNTPKISVSSDGTTVACCFQSEGYCQEPNRFAVFCQGIGAGTTIQVADAGTIGCGTDPQPVESAGGGLLFYICRYFGPPDPVGICVEPLGGDLQSFDFGTDETDALLVAPLGSGFVFVTSLGGNLSYHWADPYAAVTWPSPNLIPIAATASSSAFAIAAAGQTLGIVAHQTADTVSALAVDLDAGTLRRTVALSAPGDQPLDPVAAASCPSGFRYAYAVDGGDVLIGVTAFDGTLASDGGVTTVANLGANPRSLALIATVDGLLLAVATSSEIDVYLLPCP